MFYLLLGLPIIAFTYALGVFVFGKRTFPMKLLTAGVCAFATFYLWAIVCVAWFSHQVLNYYVDSVIGVLLSFGFYLSLVKPVDIVRGYLFPRRLTRKGEIVYPKSIPLAGDGWVRK